VALLNISVMSFSRRKFLQSSIAATASAAIGGTGSACASSVAPVQRTKGKFLNAYYFRAHMYTIVPRQVREDLTFMADLGTDAVTIALLEQDLFAAVENVEIIANEAEKLGMELHVVPSRWGGLLAGAPKVPSIFTAGNPQTWVIKENGKHKGSRWTGSISSFHHPETLAFFEKTLTETLTKLPVKGIIWDEPKLYTTVDYSDAAMEALDGSKDLKDHQLAFSQFFSNLNRFIKEKDKEVTTSLFVYANLSDDVIDSVVKIEDLDYLGCDGRPWRNEDGGEQEQANKVLLGSGERFLGAARDNGKGAFWLIENHNMSAENNAIMDKRLPEVIEKMPEHLVYYYYPRNVDKPDENMAIISKHIKKYKAN
jgi:hypothetical protein